MVGKIRQILIGRHSRKLRRVLNRLHVVLAADERIRTREAANL